jgi:hypothetical protein
MREKKRKRANKKRRRPIYFSYKQKQTQIQIEKALELKESLRLFEIKNLNSKGLVKFLHREMIHYDFKYKKGLNILEEKFEPYGSCVGKGLYFTDQKNMDYWCHYGSLIADVTIPYDAKIYCEPCGTKYKADRIILTNITEWERVDNVIKRKTIVRDLHNFYLFVILTIIFSVIGLIFTTLYRKTNL